MASVFLVRHGKAAASFGAHRDPGLAPEGHRQADATAARLAPCGPLRIYTSPLARARETAAPLAARWGFDPVVEPRVAELPTPGLALAERAAWIREVMRQRWSALDPTLCRWRDALVACVAELERDCVVFSHFIAINVVVGHARGDDRVVVFRPDHASVTECVVREGGEIEVIALGAEAQTEVR